VHGARRAAGGRRGEEEQDEDGEGEAEEDAAAADFFGVLVRAVALGRYASGLRHGCPALRLARAPGVVVVVVLWHTTEVRSCLCMYTNQNHHLLPTFRTRHTAAEETGFTGAR
jgi:hypothetical protein